MLDDDFGVLTGQLWESAVRLAPAFRQVAGGADLIDLEAVFQVRLHFQGFILLAAGLVPFLGRAGRQDRAAENQHRRKCGSDHHC